MASSLSVLMPVKNGGRFLNRAVSSTLRALPRSAELLVLNDGSTDGTTSILASYNDTRLRVFNRASSRGVARALNTLLEESESPVIARMDADDVCLPWRFVTQNRLFDRHGGVVFGNAVYCSERGWPGRPTLRIPNKAHTYAKKLLDRNLFVHPTMLAEREILASIGGYQEVGAEDYDLWLRLATRGVNFSVTLAPVLMYRQHHDQVTASRQVRNELRARWLSESTLVRSWALLADKEYGLSLADELESKELVSIDDLKRRRDYGTAVRQRV